MACHAEFYTSTIPTKARKSFQKWCRSQGLPEASQDSYERYNYAQNSEQGASNGGRSRPKAKACRGTPKYDPEEAAKHKRAVQQQLGQISRPAASATQAVPVPSPMRLRAEAPSFIPSPPYSASGLGGPSGLSPPAPMLPSSPANSWGGAWDREDEDEDAELVPEPAISRGGKIARLEALEDDLDACWERGLRRRAS